MIERMIGAARLQASVYEEVEADRSATGQAMLVVVIVALATGIGTLSVAGVGGLFVGIITALVGWAIWAWITYFVGTTLFRTAETKANWGELARSLGFAQSPGVLRVFGLIPGIGPVIFFGASVWQLVAMVVAIRQALDYTSTWRAVGVALVGFIPYVLLSTLLGLLLGAS
ncbi:MAG: YIP1 family protein [Anaerolineae bacterium]